jgi:hypothetical protein
MSKTRTNKTIADQHVEQEVFFFLAAYDWIGEANLNKQRQFLKYKRFS